MPIKCYITIHISMLIDRGRFQTWLCSLSNCVVGALCCLGIWSFAWIKKSNWMLWIALIKQRLFIFDLYLLFIYVYKLLLWLSHKFSRFVLFEQYSIAFTVDIPYIIVFISFCVSFKIHYIHQCLLLEFFADTAKMFPTLCVLYKIKNLIYLY